MTPDPNEWNSPEDAPIGHPVRVLLYYDWGEIVASRYSVWVGDELIYRWSDWDMGTIYDEEDVAGWKFVEDKQ